MQLCKLERHELSPSMPFRKKNLDQAHPSD
jgi:hypothetical protein